MREFGLNHTLILNLLIIAAVIAAVVLLREGTALLGLAFLQPLQSGVMPTDAMPDGDDSNPIGFVHHRD